MVLSCFWGGFWWLGGGWVCGLMVANIVGLFLIVNGFVKKMIGVWCGCSGVIWGCFDVMYCIDCRVFVLVGLVYWCRVLSLW